MPTYTYESKVKTVYNNEDVIFKQVADFRNFDKFMGRDVENWQRDADSCSFSIGMLGRVRLTFVDRQPNKMLKIKGESKVKFFLWLQIKQLTEKDTKIKATIKADMNPMVRMMADKPVQNFVNFLVDEIATELNHESNSGVA